MKQNFWDLVGIDNYWSDMNGNRKDLPNKHSRKASKFKQSPHIMKYIRYSFLRSPMRSMAINAAKKIPGVFICNSCKEGFGRKEVNVDHIVPVDSFDSWDNIIARVYPGVEGLQVLCKPCHLIKTKIDRKKKLTYI